MQQSVSVRSSDRRALPSPSHAISSAVTVLHRRRVVRCRCLSSALSLSSVPVRSFLFMFCNMFRSVRAAMATTVTAASDERRVCTRLDRPNSLRLMGGGRRARAAADRRRRAAGWTMGSERKTAAAAPAQRGSRFRKRTQTNRAHTHQHPRHSLLTARRTVKQEKMASLIRRDRLTNVHRKSNQG